jgi:nitrogen fixation protein FixH
VNYEGYVARQSYNDTIRLAERKAALNWRTRHMKSRESKVATAVLTSILSLFVR